MKRTLAIALSTLALAATAVQAESLPQPSFVDHAPVAAGSNAGNTSAANAHLDMPRPSFVDHVAIEPGDSSTGSSSMTLASQDLPVPSFVDYRQAL
jgi:hypothetical protein